MPLMQDIRNLFRPRRKTPLELDLTGTQAEGLADNGDSRSAIIERKPKRSMAELQQGYDEVMGLVRKIGDHLDAQTRRTEKLVELMERLPQALDALPEASRNNSRTLDLLNEHFVHSEKREHAMHETLRRLGESSGHQTEVLGLLQQQLDAGCRASEQMSQTMTGFNDALSHLATNNGRSAEVLSRLMQATDERESRLAEMMSRTQRWMIGAIIGLGVVATVAIIIALVAFLR
ncbi:MAG TPA: hypothetical protein PK400_05715 [Phycisphaerales bacterium]|nr:hypothetical protein [Phycisphaerales bacterium]HRQ76321.1 hypothetical protein [Phycisphaerales bacterium]